MEQFLIDNNCLSFYLPALLPPNGTRFMDAIIDDGPDISIISKIGLFCWNARQAIIKKSRMSSAAAILPICHPKPH